MNSKKILVKNEELFCLIKNYKIFIYNIDKIMKETESDQRGKKIADLINKLELITDKFLHFEMNYPLDGLKDFCRTKKSSFDTNKF